MSSSISAKGQPDCTIGSLFSVLVTIYFQLAYNVSQLLLVATSSRTNIRFLL